MQKVNNYQVLRLRRELRREREDRQFWEQMAFTVACVAGMLTGVLLAVAKAAGMI